MALFLLIVFARHWAGYAESVFIFRFGLACQAKF
jgi:hypothetical protein